MCWCAVVDIVDVALEEERERREAVVVADDVCEVGVCLSGDVGESECSVECGKEG